LEIWLENIGAGGLVNEAIGAISKHIRENDLMPGDRLPSEASMSKELNVSRTVVRDAFRSLATMRIIDLATGKRAAVAALDSARYFVL
jgi:GntR family transcriptional regulator, transcriptional repressor for pyruvate dehydrogenase complex